MCEHFYGHLQPPLLYSPTWLYAKKVWLERSDSKGMAPNVFFPKEFFEKVIPF